MQCAADQADEIDEMIAQVNGTKPPVILKDESESTIREGLTLVSAEALPFLTDIETEPGDEIMYIQGEELPACIKKSYAKNAVKAEALDAHWNDEDQKPPKGSLARLQYEKSVRELEHEEKKLRGENVEMSQSEIDEMIARLCPAPGSVFE